MLTRPIIEGACGFLAWQ